MQAKILFNSIIVISNQIIIYFPSAPSEEKVHATHVEEIGKGEGCAPEVVSNLHSMCAASRFITLRLGDFARFLGQVESKDNPGTR